MNWLRCCKTAIRFLTIIPLPGREEGGEENFSHALFFFPLVGLGIGAVSGLLVWLLGPVIAPFPLAVISVGVLAGWSGALHLDGLADTADGFFSSRPRERILEIMRDSHIGAMGVIALVLVLLLKISCLASLEPSVFLRAVLLMPLVGRCAILVMMAVLPYARKEGGLGGLFYGDGVRMQALWGLLLSVIIAWLVGGLYGVSAVLVGVAFTLFFCGYCKRVIGGATGDTLGAACELAEAGVALGYCLMLGR